MAKIIKVVYDVDSKELDTAKKKVVDIEKETKKSEDGFQKLGQTGSKAFGLISSIAATIGLAAIGKQIIEITAEFQKLSAVLTNTLGSRSAAQQALATIKQFAAQTPFSVVELTDSFVKLANQGFKPTIEQLRSLGDLASSQGKSFNQLTEAIIDAQTGEFERLKEFGIRASKEGNKVTFTFKGVQTQAKFTSEAIREYILSLGDAQGVSGSMAAISETLGGRISNLGDSWDSLLNTIGDGNKGPIADVISLLGDVISKVNDLIKTSEQLNQEYRQGIVQTQLEAAKSFAKGFKDQNEALNFFANNLERKAQQINQAYGEIVEQQIKSAATEWEQIWGLSDARKAELTQLESKRQALGNEYLALVESAQAIREYITQLKGQTKTTKEQSGLIESLELRLKELKEARQKAFSVSEIQRFNREIEQTEKQLKKLIGGAGTGFKDIKPDETASKIEKAFDQAWDATTGKQNDALAKLNGTLDKHVKKFQDAEKSKTEAAKKEAEERARFEEERMRYITDLTYQLGAQTAELLLTRREIDTSSMEAYYAKEIELAGDNEAAKENLEKQRDRKLRDAERRNKQIQKDNARSRIGIDTAVGIMKTFAEFGWPAGIVPAALLTAISLTQLANVRKYKDGQVNIDGPGTSTSDSIPAWLSKGESVINAESTRNSRNLLEAINDRKIDDRILQVAATNGGRQVNVFDDSRLIKEIRESRVQYENHGYTLMKHSNTTSNFKLLMRAKNQGY